MSLCELMPAPTLLLIRACWRRQRRQRLRLRLPARLLVGTIVSNSILIDPQYHYCMLKLLDRDDIAVDRQS